MAKKKTKKEAKKKKVAKSKKSKRFTRKKLIILGAIILVLLLILVFKPGSNARVVSNPGEYRYAPLEQAEVQVVANALISSEFIHDVPEKDPIALFFYSFDSQGRVWRDSFLIGRGQLLQTGEPSVYLSLDAKYIPYLQSYSLCDIASEANKNGDLGFDSEFGKARLLLKYKGMLKHRECFGF